MPTQEGVDSDVEDYGDDADAAPTAIDAAFAQLDKLCIDAERVEQKAAQHEREQKVAAAEYKRITEQLIPELMLQMRMTKCTTRTGIEIEIKQDVRCSLPGADEQPEKREAAIAWLIESGNAGVVKNLISVALERGQDDRATALAKQLTEQGFDATVKKDVPHQTLGKLARELLEEGSKFPKQLFNFFDQKVAKLKRKR